MANNDCTLPRLLPSLQPPFDRSKVRLRLPTRPRSSRYSMLPERCAVKAEGIPKDSSNANNVQENTPSQTDRPFHRFIRRLSVGFGPSQETTSTSKDQPLYSNFRTWHRQRFSNRGKSQLIERDRSPLSSKKSAQSAQVNTPDVSTYSCASIVDHNPQLNKQKQVAFPSDNKSINDHRLGNLHRWIKRKSMRFSDINSPPAKLTAWHSVRSNKQEYPTKTFARENYDNFEITTHRSTDKMNQKADEVIGLSPIRHSMFNGYNKSSWEPTITRLFSCQSDNDNDQSSESVGHKRPILTFLLSDDTQESPIAERRGRSSIASSISSCTSQSYLDDIKATDYLEDCVRGATAGPVPLRQPTISEASEKRNLHDPLYGISSRFTTGEWIASKEQSSSVDTGLNSQFSTEPLDERAEDINEAHSDDANANLSRPQSAWTMRQHSTGIADRECRLRAGQTIFNRCPEEGIHYLSNNDLIASDAKSLAIFIFTAVGLNRQAIGEYFGTLKNTTASLVLKEFMQLVDMKNREVDEALRSVLTYFRPSGESQKISHLVQTFQEVYLEQNPSYLGQRFRKADTIEVLAYSILMLQTDLHNPNVRRAGRRMKATEFVHNNRGIDGGEDVSAEMLQAVYQRVSETEFKTLPDPEFTLNAINMQLTGPLKTDTFMQRHRHFISWAQCQEVKTITGRTNRRSKQHGRYLLLFNDIVIIAKNAHRGNTVSASTLSVSASTSLVEFNRKSQSRENIRLSADTAESKKFADTSLGLLPDGTYQIRHIFPIMDMHVLVFETSHYHFGIQLCNTKGPLYSLNVDSSQTRRQITKWINDIIAEIHEVRRYYQLKADQKKQETERPETSRSGSADQLQISAKTSQGSGKPNSPRSVSQVNLSKH